MFLCGPSRPAGTSRRTPFNVTALLDTSGTVQEQYVYDPYGERTVLTAAWGGTSPAGLLT